MQVKRAVSPIPRRASIVRAVPNTSYSEQEEEQEEEEVTEVLPVVVRKRSVAVFFMWCFLLGVLAMSFLLWAASYASSAFYNWRLDTTYGNPRTYQVDQVVGHSDSPDHPTHFIVINLKGRVEVIEFPGGNVAKSKIYEGPIIIADNPTSVPVTITFTDANGDGKLDMVIHIGETSQIMFNTGDGFSPVAPK